MGNEKYLKLTQAEIDIIVDVIHRVYPNHDVNDISMAFVNKGITLSEAQEFENGEIVFPICVRFKKENSKH